MIGGLLRWGPWLALAAPAALAMMTISAIVAAYSPAPYQDYWDTVWWWREIVRNGLPPEWLASQHNEHRILLPRLVFIADFKWFRGTGVLNLAVIGLIQMLGALLFLRVGLKRGGALPVLGAAVAAGLIVSLAQWENLFWGFQIQAVGVAAAGSWAIWHFARADDETGGGTIRLAAATLLLATATYSMANGLFAGVAMVLAGLAARRDWRPILVAFIATAALAALYLRGYQAVAHHSPASVSLADPLGFVNYAMNYLGNVWALGHRPGAALVGLVGSGLTAAMAVLLFRDRGRDPAQVAMFGIVLFMGMSACATALGRLGLGMEYSLSSRYATGSCYFWAAQAIFWALRLRPWALPFRIALGGFFVVALVALFAIQHVHRPGLQDAHARMVRGAAAMLAVRDDEEAFRALYPDPDKVRELTPFLRDQRLSVFAHEDGR